MARSSNLVLRLRNLENMHITLWLVKDTCWVLLFKPLGMLMIIPTLSVAVYLTVRSWKDVKERLHNLAVCCWITANSTWMAGEFYFQDNWRRPALFFFAAGLMCIGVWHLSNFRNGKKRVPPPDPVIS